VLEISGTYFQFLFLQSRLVFLISFFRATKLNAYNLSPGRAISPHATIVSDVCVMNRPLFVLNLLRDGLSPAWGTRQPCRWRRQVLPKLQTSGDIQRTTWYCNGARGSVVVETLCYKPDDIIELYQFT
jgi:hypothetical protein